MERSYRKNQNESLGQWCLLSLGRITSDAELSYLDSCLLLCPRFGIWSDSWLSQVSLPSWFSAPPPGQVVPATVLHHDGHALTLAVVQDTLAQFSKVDDVFRSGFTQDAFMSKHPPPVELPVPTPGPRPARLTTTAAFRASWRTTSSQSL